MKTNVILTRKMGEFDVLQRTSDGFFNASILMKQWNNDSGQKKNVNHYLDNSSTKEFIQAIINDDDNIRNSEKPTNHVLTKSKSKTNKDGSKEVGEIFMSPLLFIDFAMWLNPAFKVKVLKFVYDQLIKYRNDAGDAYNEMTSSIKKIVQPHFVSDAIRNVAKAINHVVYGNHEKGMRNKVGEENKTRELYEIERDISKLIDNGFITSYEQLLIYLRKEWNKKWQPKMLQA